MVFTCTKAYYCQLGQTWPPDQIAGFILLVFIVPLSYHYFEMPIMMLKHKYQRNELKNNNALGAEPA